MSRVSKAAEMDTSDIRKKYEELQKQLELERHQHQEELDQKRQELDGVKQQLTRKRKRSRSPGNDLP